MPSSKFIESLIGVRAASLHRRLMKSFGWSDDVTADFLTRVGLGLLGGLRNNPDLDIASLSEPPELFSLVTTLDLAKITTELSIEPADAWQGARWAAVALVDATQEGRRNGKLRLAGVCTHR